jgi:hypothetical protein
MASFKDNKGRTWFLKLDGALIEDIEEKTGISVDSFLRGLKNKSAEEITPLGDLFDDWRKFLNVLWFMVQEQLPTQARPVTNPKEFAAAFDGDVLEAAADAFFEALADFTPRHQRAVNKALMARGKELIEEAVPQILERIKRLSLSTPSMSSESLPVSWDSTPVPEG